MSSSEIQLFFQTIDLSWISPPVAVNVANSYSAMEKPALLWAVTFRLYQVAGFRSSTTKLPPGFTLFDTTLQSCFKIQLTLNQNTEQ